MNRLVRPIAALSIALIPAVATANGATGILDGACRASDSQIACEKGPSLFGPGSVFLHAINVLLFVIGSIAVLMIVIGGLRFVLAAGNPANVKAARETILYAVIGLVVAALAYAIVNFVLGAIG